MISHFVVILIALAFSAFFSGMEIAFVSSNKLRIELDKNQGTFASRIISIFAKNPGQYIATMLVGNNIALVIYSIFMALVLEPFIEQITSQPITILIIQTILSTLIILITAEFLPKTLFRSNANNALNIFSLPVLLFYIIFYPITRLTIFISKWLINSFFKEQIERKNAGDNQLVFGKVDLDNFLSESQPEIDEDNEIEHEIKIFQNALDFSKVKLRECMVPRTEIAAIEENQHLNELKEKLIETGFSKIPVYKESIDNIIGYFHSSEFFRNPDDIRSKIIQPLFVPETMPANKLLGKFIQQHKSMAVVVDEFGGTAGIVTIEDIMEEIFGEIEDEHDNIEFIERKISDCEYIFSGRLEIDYINEKYNLNIPESEEYETVAGFILNQHNNIPAAGDKIVIEPFVFKIIKVSKTKIEIVNLKIKREN